MSAHLGFRSRTLPTVVADCLEPFYYGTNQLLDPGLESWIANTGGGPNGDEIPDTSQQWSDGSDAGFTYWVQDFDVINSPDRRWKVSTANPYAGTYHFRNVGRNFVNTEHTAPGDAVYAWNFEWCDSPAYSWGWASQIAVGDFISVTLRAMASSTIGTPHMWVGVVTYDSSGSFVDDFSAHSALSTSYQSFSTSGTASSGVKYLLVYFGVSEASGELVPVDFTCDVDNVALDLTAA